MKRVTIVIAAMAIAVGGSIAPSQAGDLMFFTGPGGQFVNYTVPALVIQEGDNVTFTNIDIAAHDVVSTLPGGTEEPWCALFDDPLSPGIDPCRLFQSELLGLGRQGPIYGLPALAQGTYAFVCSIHSNMEGTLVVAP